MSVYSNSIPQPGDFLSDSQQDILNNFIQLDTTMGQDHYNFSDNTSNNGKHKQTRFVNEAAIPAGLVTGEGTLYTKAVSSESQAFYSPDDTGREYQMTRTVEASFSSFANTAGTSSSGWTFLPGGILMQYGLKTVDAKGTATTITFPVEFTGTPFSITIGNVTNEGNSPGANNQFIKDGSVSTTSFDIVNSSSSSARKVYWMAIGV